MVVLAWIKPCNVCSPIYRYMKRKPKDYGILLTLKSPNITASITYFKIYFFLINYQQKCSYISN